MAKAKTTLKRPLRRLTQAELDGFLDKAADILRGNVDHSEFRGYVFALLFFKRISDVYQEEVRKLTEQLGDEDLAKDPKMHNFVVPEECLWDEVARKSRNELGTALNDAMIAIERANQPKFDGILTNKIDFNKNDELPREKLINLINHFGSQTFDKGHVPDDVFGNAYEHLINSFASKAGKSSGEFYTPAQVAYLMAEIVEPQEGNSVCDWAMGSGGLLLQCRNYVKRKGGDPNRLLLFAQESNIATYNIARINMILHGVPSWRHEQGDSLRNPKLRDDRNNLLQFDRIVMNPPFSLEDWGYDDLLAGDPLDRFGYGMPPRDNGDYAWLQQVVKTLKDNGKAIIVMSQGVLFRGQPEQTEEEDGRNQKADAEYLIREGFIREDVVECVIILPGKVFYGNTVPGCLIVLNRKKPLDRQGKILFIWAARDFKKANPQNLLRPCDLMRVLIPYRAFGELEFAKTLIAPYESMLIKEEEQERDRRLMDIEDAYAPLLEELPKLREYLLMWEQEDYKTWNANPKADHPFFGELLGITDKKALKVATSAARARYTAAIKEAKARVKYLTKIELERDQAEQDVRTDFDREIELLRATATDLHRVCSCESEALKYFSVANIEDLAPNEFNLNASRYIEALPDEPVCELQTSLQNLSESEERREKAMRKLQAMISKCEVPHA